MKKRILLAALAIAMSAISIYAQKPAGIGLAIEIDPATFVFNGYGIHLRYQPRGSDHLMFGIGAYAMDMPDILVGMNSENRDQGWRLRLNQGFGIFAEHHFLDVHEKWFVGGQLGLQEYQIENEEVGGKETYSNLLAMAYGGYTWKPFGFNLYIKPWAGIGYTSKISGSNELGNKAYQLAPVTMFATLHLGYNF